MKLNLNYKRIVISLLAFSLLIFNVPVYAENIDSYNAVISTNKDNVTKGEEITITISLEDINIESGEKGIGAYTANLNFNPSALEYVSSAGTDKWEAPMYYNGKIVGNTKDGKVMTEEGNIGTITFKVKEDADLGEITVSLVNFSGSNAVNDIKAPDYSTKITVKDGEAGNTGDNEQGGDEGQGGNQGEAGDSQGGSQGENGNTQSGSGSQGGNGNTQGGNENQNENGNTQGGNENQNENANQQNGNDSQAGSGDNNQGENGNQSESGNNSQNGTQNGSTNSDNKGNSNEKNKFPNSLPKTGESNIILYLIAGTLFLAISACLGIKLLKSKK